MGKTRRERRFLRATGWILLLIVFTCVLIYVLHRPSLEVVARWKQPSDLKYDDGGPYCLSVVETDIDWRGFPHHVDRNHLIYAGNESGTLSHGHVIDFSFHAWPEDLPTFLSKAEVEWSPEGVQLNLPSGHRLFIPAEMFTGGR